MSLPPRPVSEAVLVLAPLGRDGALACEVLRRARVDAMLCTSMSELCARVHDAGAAIVTAEALTPAARAELVHALGAQEPWSDLPIVIFSNPGSTAGADDVRVLGNATLLDRPVAVRELVSAVGGALRARRRQYQARLAIEQRDHFLAMLGHELRNPLAAISLAVAGLERIDDPVRKRKHVGVLKRQSEHLTRLVDDLLDVARVTTGRIELARRPLDINELVERCTQNFEALASSSGVTLSVHPAPAPVFVNGDDVRLEQIFNNLLTNALKYTPAGGRVDVDVSAGASFVALSVRDTGMGIPPDTLPNVFDLFVQAPSTIDRARGGLGIGLTLVRALALLHGGTVEAHSAGVGRGAELVVRLPRIVAPAAEAARSDAPDTDGKRRVLVVDDSDDVRESLRDILEDLGHDVFTAADGSGGLAQLLEHVPAIAFIDIGLPGIDGYEVARAARRALGARVRLVALTGYGQPDDKRRAKDAGFDEHFTKPVDVRALEELLAQPVAH